MIHLFDILKCGIRINPDGTAITHGERKLTYAQLGRQVQALADHLRQAGVQPGDRVALLWENSPEYVTAYFAISAAGGVVTPIDTSLKPDRVAFILNDCQAQILISQFKLSGAWGDSLTGVRALRHVISDQPLTGLPPRVGQALLSECLTGSGELPDTDTPLSMTPPNHDSLGECSDDLAAIFYTSGSTGRPKGVMLSHRNLVSNTVATVEYLGLQTDDSVMVILPFYYIYGNSLMLTHMMMGARLVIDNRFAFAQVILSSMAKEKVTGFSGVPSSFMMLLDKKGFNSHALPELRYLTQAGGAMAPEVTRRVVESFPDRELFVMYGQTEASPRVSYCPPEKLADKIGSIGIPVPGVTIELAAEDGSLVPADEVGEIVVSGPNVMLGYWNSDDPDEQVLQDGKLLTGDLARRDPDGYFFIVARKKEIIKVGGNRVSAKEIEECLMELASVSEVAIIGISDDVLGEAIRAYLVLSDNSLEESDIANHCRTMLAIHKVPKEIVFLTELPKYQSGKVNKLALSNSS